MEEVLKQILSELKEFKEEFQEFKQETKEKLTSLEYGQKKLEAGQASLEGKIDKLTEREENHFNQVLKEIQYTYDDLEVKIKAVETKV